MKGSRDAAETKRLTLLKCFQAIAITKIRLDQRQQFASNHIFRETDFSNRAAVTMNGSSQWAVTRLRCLERKLGQCQRKTRRRSLFDFASSIKLGKFAFVHQVSGRAIVIVNRDLPVEHENLCTVWACRNNETCSEINELPPGRFHDKSNPLRRHNQLDLPLMQRHALVAVQL